MQHTEIIKADDAVNEDALGAFITGGRWTGQIFLRDAFVCHAQCDFPTPLPSELHIQSKVPVVHLLQLLQGLPRTCQKQNLYSLIPTNPGLSGKLSAYLLRNKSAGVMHLSDSVFYLIPSSTEICQALDLKTEKDALLCFVMNTR